MSSVSDVLVSLATSVEDHQIFYTSKVKSERSQVFEAASGQQLLSNNDPFSIVRDNLENKQILTTVITDEHTLLKSLPILDSLKSYPVIINTNLTLGDYSIIPAFKDLSFPILISNSVESLQQNLKTISDFVSTKSSSVIHFIDYKIFDAASVENLDFKIEKFELKVEGSESELEETQFESFKLYGENQDTADYLIVNLSSYSKQIVEHLPSNTALIDVLVYRPWNFQQFLDLLPKNVKKIVLLQGANSKPSVNGFEPILLDFFADFNKLVERKIDQLLVSNIGRLSENDIAKALESVVANLKLAEPDFSLFVGEAVENDKNSLNQISSSVENVRKLEQAYIKVLNQIFKANMTTFNEFSSTTINANTPEYGFGRFLFADQKRQQIIELAKISLNESVFPFDEGKELITFLSTWLEFNNSSLEESKFESANKLAASIFDIFKRNASSKRVSEFLKISDKVEDYEFKTSWLIGSDAWSYDLGNSGVHQVLSSGKNINVLLIDSEPYEKVKNDTRKERKKDVGLYAMNYGKTFVASVAVYSSYTQLLTAIIEAARYNGPSIVLAYLPYHSENDTALEILKETKVAVESGYWPLYRYDPSKDTKENFTLDSSVIKEELQKFLDRENKLTLLTQKSPDFARNLKNSASDSLTKLLNKRAKAAYDQLLEGLSGPPIHIYYASDGGNATSLSKKLGMRASARGFKAIVLSMDDIDLEQLPNENNVIFVTSTAGQGEFPQDGKAFWDALKSSADLDLSSLNFSVFGLGDSLYWPRKEDAHYYNKPSKDLFKRLEILSAKPIIPLGLGDDQDADGFQTGYKDWENSLWEALGVANVAVADEPKELTNEDMKAASNFLRGTIKEGLADDSTGAVCAVDQQLTKFHGFYMQDDRDIRDVRKSQGLEPYYSFMIRCRLPGGKVSPDQWLALDHLADNNGVGTLKITTRATMQLHGVIKKDVKHTLRSMNATLMDTLAACGDVNRNVSVSVLPSNAEIHKQVSDVAYEISEYFLPKTTAYHEIWLNGPDDRDDDPNWPSIFENRNGGPTRKKTLVAGNALVDVEPLLSPVYLPRKFKVNIAIPPYNDVDVWSSDVGLIAIIDKESKQLTGFNVYVGGGMGTTHNNKKTYPRTGSSFGYVETKDIFKVIEGVMIVQRDNGDRKNRKHARLKYTIDDMGVDVYKQKVEEIWGKTFQPEAKYEITSNIDYFGWVKDETGLNHCTLFIENGRVADTVDLPQKSGMKKIAQHMKKHGGHFRLTGNQHAVISDIKDEHLDEIKKLMKEHKLDDTNFSGLRMSSAACVALPTCGLAMAESERYLPVLITKIEDILEENGLRHDSIVMRMTGCPNGCSRPWLAELALIGKAPETYNLMLGGGYHGQRLNKLYRASIKEEEILDTLRPLFKSWAENRQDGEHFGDYLIRSDVIKPTLEGKYFHDDLPIEAL